MSRVLAVNYLLVGVILGFVFATACDGAGRANAADPVQCVIDGPIEVEIVASKGSPVPVMVCDGATQNGTCANVDETANGNEIGTH